MINNQRLQLEVYLHDFNQIESESDLKVHLRPQIDDI